MDGRILKELQFQNLLSCMAMMDDHTEHDKVLNYIFDRELKQLQLDIVLFPKQQAPTKEYTFHKEVNNGKNN